MDRIKLLLMVGDSSINECSPLIAYRTSKKDNKDNEDKDQDTQMENILLLEAPRASGTPRRG